MRRALVLLAVAAALAAAAWGGSAYVDYRSRPLLEIVNAPERYPRRGAWISANVTGLLSASVEACRWRVNGGDWRALAKGSRRTSGPHLTLEIPPHELREGENRVELLAEAALRPDERHELSFHYDPSPIGLPLLVDWEHAPLEAQDGVWERVSIDGEWRVRPVPGTEGYDRILLVTGALPGGRRVETDVIFRHAATHRPEQIVGVLSLWGGHVDAWDVAPRRGWSFAMACWWSKPGGAGAEISHCVGGEEPAWVNSYRDLPLEPGVRHRVVAETQPLRAASGAHAGWRHRVAFWPAAEAQPEHWIELVDVEGAPLPDAEYAVGLLLYRCQADFGPVRVEALPDLVVGDGG